MSTHPARHVSVSIARPPAAVAAYLADGEKLPTWASGLGNTIRRGVEGEWLADGPLGRIRVRFAPTNDLGVFDHDVTLESGETVHNPLRVLPNGDGSEVVFTLFQRPDVSSQALDEDAAAVTQDLGKLKSLLEA